MGSNTPDPATDPAADDTFSFDPDALRAAAHPEMPREQTELGRALAAGIRPGDHIFVDTTCYGVPGVRRCRVIGLSPGTAAVYPIKFEVPGRGEGQCKLGEVAGHDPRGRADKS